MQSNILENRDSSGGRSLRTRGAVGRRVCGRRCCHLYLHCQLHVVMLAWSPWANCWPTSRRWWTHGNQWFLARWPIPHHLWTMDSDQSFVRCFRLSFTCLYDYVNTWMENCLDPRWETMNEIWAFLRYKGKVNTNRKPMQWGNNIWGHLFYCPAVKGGHLFPLNYRKHMMYLL